MSLKSANVSCNWPGCQAFTILKWSEDRFTWDGWSTLGNDVQGPHLCPVHAKHSKEELDRLMARLKDARKMAKEVIGLVMESGTKMYGNTSPLLGCLVDGARMAFDKVFPGAEDIWKEVFKAEKAQRWD